MRGRGDFKRTLAGTLARGGGRTRPEAHPLTCHYLCGARLRPRICTMRNFVMVWAPSPRRQYMFHKLALLCSAAGLVMTVACSQTDPGITTAVKTKFAADDTVKAYQIDVDTSKGVVTLTGTVEVPAAKEQAVLIARRTDGVKDVID